MVVGSDTSKIFMVMEYMEHDLKMLMEAMTANGVMFSQSEVKCLMTQLVSAINYMHSLWFLHRDLKTSNLLYGSDGTVREHLLRCCCCLDLLGLAWLGLVVFCCLFVCRCECLWIV